MDEFKIQELQPTNSIRFFNGGNPEARNEVLRISSNGVWANPDIPVDEAARLVLQALDVSIKQMVARAVEAEREACADICKKHADVYGAFESTPEFQAAWAACIDIRDAIRARGES